MKVEKEFLRTAKPTRFTPHVNQKVEVIANVCHCTVIKLIKLKLNTAMRGGGNKQCSAGAHNCTKHKIEK